MSCESIGAFSTIPGCEGESPGAPGIGVWSSRAADGPTVAIGVRHFIAFRGVYSPRMPRANNLKLALDGGAVNRCVSVEVEASLRTYITCCNFLVVTRLGLSL